jgi:hypothetical protein
MILVLIIVMQLHDEIDFFYSNLLAEDCVARELTGRNNASTAIVENEAANFSQIHFKSYIFSSHSAEA